MTAPQMMRDAISRALAAVRLPFRAILGGLNGAPAVQLAQGDALSGEKLEAAEVFQQFGFTSGVPAGSTLIVVPLGGKTAHGVIVATENGSYRVQVASGEVCVYNQWGAKITLKKEKIIEIDCEHLVIKASEDVTVQTKSVSVEASTGVTCATPGLAFGGHGGDATTATIRGQVSIDGSISSTGDQIAAGISTASHTHQGDSGGTTGQPR